MSEEVKASFLYLFVSLVIMLTSLSVIAFINKKGIDHTTEKAEEIKTHIEVDSRQNTQAINRQIKKIQTTTKHIHLTHVTPDEGTGHTNLAQPAYIEQIPHTLKGNEPTPKKEREYKYHCNNRECERMVRRMKHTLILTMEDC